MTTIKTNGLEILVVEVPRDIDSYWIYWDGIEQTIKLSNNNNWTMFSKKLEGNPNDYKIIGLLHDISESECEGLVEREMWSSPWDEEVLITVWKSYNKDLRDYYATAKKSLISLLQANGLNTSNNLLLIEKI